MEMHPSDSGPLSLARTRGPFSILFGNIGVEVNQVPSPASPWPPRRRSTRSPAFKLGQGLGSDDPSGPAAHQGCGVDGLQLALRNPGTDFVGADAEVDGR